MWAGEMVKVILLKRDAKEKEVLNTETGEYIQTNHQGPDGHY